jgi:hypothetical protein
MFNIILCLIGNVSETVTIKQLFEMLRCFILTSQTGGTECWVANIANYIYYICVHDPINIWWKTTSSSDEMRDVCVAYHSLVLNGDGLVFSLFILLRLQSYIKKRNSTPSE